MNESVVLAVVEVADAAGRICKGLVDVRGVGKDRHLHQVPEAAQTGRNAAKNKTVERLPVARLNGVKARSVGLAVFAHLLPDVLGLHCEVARVVVLKEHDSKERGERVQVDGKLVVLEVVKDGHGGVFRLSTQLKQPLLVVGLGEVAAQLADTLLGVAVDVLDKGELEVLELRIVQVAAVFIENCLEIIKRGKVGGLVLCAQVVNISSTAAWMPSSFWLTCAIATAAATVTGSKGRLDPTGLNYPWAEEPLERTAELEKSPSFAYLSVAPAGSFTRYSCSPTLERDESPTPSEVISPNGNLTASARVSSTLSDPTGVSSRSARLSARAPALVGAVGVSELVFWYGCRPWVWRVDLVIIIRPLTRF